MNDESRLFLERELSAALKRTAELEDEDTDLRNALTKLHARSQNQRRELRRLNKYLRAFWTGARFSWHVKAEQEKKGAEREKS